MALRVIRDGFGDELEDRAASRSESRRCKGGAIESSGFFCVSLGSCFSVRFILGFKSRRMIGGHASSLEPFGIEAAKEKERSADEDEGPERNKTVAIVFRRKEPS